MDCKTCMACPESRHMFSDVDFGCNVKDSGMFKYIFECIRLCLVCKCIICREHVLRLGLVLIQVFACLQGVISVERRVICHATVQMPMLPEEEEEEVVVVEEVRISAY